MLKKRISAEKPDSRCPVNCGILLGGMNKLIIAAFIGLSCVVMTAAQAPAPTRPATRKAAPAVPAPAAAAQKPAAAPVSPANELTAAPAHDLFARYCVNCHSEKGKPAGMDSARKLTNH